MSVIRTPDQRLRVFVSSTIEELASERVAARRAIENLRLSPILFELGARPHPPRDLYRAYLEQSHVFVGIYWESYGWVAPGMGISGLEDEYELAGDRPKLIYIKTPAPDRQEELADLLGRIENDARVSYRRFQDQTELQQLIENDLALLLTEHFQNVESNTDRGSDKSGRVSGLPSGPDPFIGRASELDSLCRLITDGSARLITLTGAGGIGKTRLAIEAAARCEGSFKDGCHLVTLGSITKAEFVVSTIVQTLNVQGSNAQPLDALIGYLRDWNLLLILDNFEQVVHAAPEIASIVDGCPEVTVLVTSRALLNLRVEREYQVSPLSLPPEEMSASEVAAYDAIKLFVERAQAIDPNFQLTTANASVISSICRSLDGLPLALELAAARTRVLRPEAMLERLDTSLQFLTSGSRDAPERHKTLRAAIDWSFGLLDPNERKLFVRMGAFHGGCTLEAAEAVCNYPSDLNLLDVMTSLLEKSLIKHDAHAGEPRFSMLRTVWEFANEHLDQSDDVDAVRSAHANFFLALASASHEGLRSSGQTAWLERLETDHDNLRAAMRWSLDNGAAQAVADAGWTVWLFWWLDSHLAEARHLMGEALDKGILSEVARARASAVMGLMAFWQTDYAEGVPLLSAALQAFREQKDMAGVALCQLPLGFAEAAAGAAETAHERFEESIRYFREAGDDWGVVMSMNALCWTANAVDIDPGDDIYEEALQRAQKLGTELDIGLALRNLGGHRSNQGELEEAKRLLSRALEMLWRGYVRGGTTYTIDGIAEIAANTGAHPVATQLFAATHAVRQETKAPIIPMFAPRFERFVEELRREMGDATFDLEWARGSELGLEGAARLALEWVRHDEVAATS